MSRALVVINSSRDRLRALSLLEKVPFGSRVEFKAAKRSIPQNDRMYAMLTEIARQLPWHGVKLRADDWKFLFLDALKRELRMVPNLDGDGFVNLGRSSSDLTKGEMGDLMTLMEEFGARHGVVFQDQVPQATERAVERPAAAQNVRSEGGAGHGSRGAA